MAVELDGRIRLVPAQQRLASDPYRGQPLRAQGMFGIDGRETRGQQQLVAAAQGDIQGRAERDDHLAAGTGAPGFEKSQMTRGYARFQRQIELADTALRAPAFQDRTKIRSGDSVVGV